MSYKISIHDPMYPYLLKEIPDAPQEIFIKGELYKNTFDFCIAVVGSRKMTPYGKRVLYHLISNFSNLGITVVSGFMYGVDITAHRIALETGAKTIAVMPCGIDAIYPRSFKTFYKKMCSDGNLVLSEYAGDMSPQKWTFPKRNRIVAGISHATLVIEAAKSSGSLITAKLALDYNRRVFAVPGSIFSDVSQGTNKLISQGAVPVSDISDILQDFGIVLEEVALNNTPSSLSTEAVSVLRSLNSSPASFDDLVYSTGIYPDALSSLLVSLEIQAKVKCRAGYYYAC